MKALVYESPQKLKWQEYETPTANGEEIVSVTAAGICGSDMHAYLGHDSRRPPPLILGHEASAILADGKLVIINPLVVCGNCQYCLAGRDNLCEQRQIISMPPRQGAFAEKLRIPRRNMLPLPSTLSIVQGALCEPLACGYHAARLAAQRNNAPINELEAAVIGGGAIGLATALSLIAFGVKLVHIAEANPLRHNALKKAGDFAVSSPDKLPSSPIVIDAVGSAKTRDLAAATVQPGGVIIHIGLADNDGGGDMRRTTLQEILWQGAYTYTTEDFLQTATWMGEGKLGKLDWHEERPLQDGAKAFADLLAGKVAAPKIVLMP